MARKNALSLVEYTAALARQKPTMTRERKINLNAKISKNSDNHSLRSPTIRNVLSNKVKQGQKGKITYIVNPKRIYTYYGDIIGKGMIKKS